MIFLLLSIASSTAILLLFKAFEKWDIHTFEAIVINYMICAVFGFLIQSDDLHLLKAFWQTGWFPIAIVLGVLFITGFYAMNLTVVHNGVTVASVASRNSIIISVTAAFFLYGEEVNAWKIAGIFLAIFAIYFSSKKEKDPLSNIRKSTYLLYPLAILIISGLNETLINFAQVEYLDEEMHNGFLIFLFGTAGAIGLLLFTGNWLYYKLAHVSPSQLKLPKDLAAPKHHLFKRKNLLAGLFLGVANYGSIYFIIKTLEQPDWQSSVVFPVNNVGVVLASALLAFIIFKEHISRINLFGIALAVLAIALIAIGK